MSACAARACAGVRAAWEAGGCFGLCYLFIRVHLRCFLSRFCACRAANAPSARRKALGAAPSVRSPLMSAALHRYAGAVRPVGWCPSAALSRARDGAFGGLGREVCDA